MEENAPDVTAYRLDEAINILEKKGIKFKLKKTSPFRSGLWQEHEEKAAPNEKYRIVKQLQLEDHFLELTIALVE